MTQRLKVRDMGQSAFFDGSTNGLQLPGYTPPASFSFAFWIKVRKYVASDRIFDFSNSGPSNGFSFLLDANRKFLFNIFNGASAEVAIVSPEEVQLRKWYHVAVTVEANSAKLYINGALVATDTAFTMTAPTAMTPTIGKRSAAASNYTGANIKQFIFAERVLTLPEIANHCFEGINPINLKYKIDFNGVSTDEYGNTTTDVGTLAYRTDSPVTLRTTTTSRSNAQSRVSTQDMGTMLRFDGVDDQVTTPLTSAKFDPTQPYTITFDLMDIPFVTTSLGIAGMWLASAGQRNFGILIGSTRRVSFVIRNSVDASINSDAAVSVRRSMRNFVAVRFDGTNMQVYVNGTWNTPTAIIPAAAGAQAILIGRANSAANPFYKGRIDNFRVFQKGLSDAEIDNLNYMNIVPEEILAQYLFDEASGSTALDTSGNGNDATIVGATYTTDVPLRLRTTA